MKVQTAKYLSISLFFALLVWGTYSLLYYLGVPVHGAVLLTSGADSIQCPPNGYICRGIVTLVPFLWDTITRVPVFMWYAIISFIAYICYVTWGYLQSNRFVFRATVTPLKIILFFVGCLWLIYTCVSYTESGDASIRRMVEPIPQVYVNAGPESLQALRENFDALKDRGCLRYDKVFGNTAAGEYTYRTWCVQVSFFTRVVPVVVFVLVFLFELLVLGRFLYARFSIRAPTTLVEMALHLGLGICGWIAILWIFAVIGVYTMWVGWILAVLIPAALYKHSLHYLRLTKETQWDVQYKWYSTTMVLTWLLVSYLALNLLNIVRPFPIGWDDLGSYINRPHLLVSYGKFVFSMASFQWEYLTSLGYLLFGFNSWFGATIAMAINWTAGLVAVLFTYTFARTFLGEDRGLLSATLYYLLPIVGHFSFADMKIDNAVYAMGTLATFTVFLWLFYRGDEEYSYKPALPLLVMAGVFAGFAFGMKVTSIMIIMMLGATILGATLHWSANIAAIFVAIAIFTKQGALTIPSILQRVHLSSDAISANMFAVICIGIGAIIFATAAYLNKKKLQPSLVAAVLFVAGVFVSVFPWTYHNTILQGSFVPKMTVDAVNTISPAFDVDGNYGDDIRPVQRLPEELQVDKSHEYCSPSGLEEELGRYWGYDQGWDHYFTLPFRTVMNLDSAGYYVTSMPALLLFPLLLLLPFFWLPAGRWARWLWAGTAFLIAQWVFMANGVPWYGIGMFMGLSILLEVLLAKSPDKPNKIILSIFITIAIFTCLAQRIWQFEQQRNIFEYPLGKITAETLRERTIPYYDDITDILVERHESMPDRPYVYRVGTFIPYFVPRNLEVIGLADHQLDFFNCMYQDRDPQKMLARLKALGFNSIIFDTNTATIEKDPLGTLHQKVNAFTDFLNNPELGFRIVLNDPNAGVAFLLIP